MRKIGLASVLLGTAALSQVLHDRPPSAVLLASAHAQCLSPQAALTAAIATDALRATSSAYTFCRRFGFRVPPALHFLSAKLLRLKANLLAPNPAHLIDPVLIHLAATADPAHLLDAQIPHHCTVAVELDVAALADEAPLAQYGKSVLVFAAAWSSYLAECDAIGPLPPKASTANDEDNHPISAAIYALTQVADVAMAHGIAVIITCDASREENIYALVGTAALASLLARVYGTALPLFLKLQSHHHVHLEPLKGSMFEPPNIPGFFLTGQACSGQSRNDVAFVDAQDIRDLKQVCNQNIVYSKGIADLHVSRLRKFANANLIRREVISDSAVRKREALSRITATEHSRNALKMESAALWSITFRHLRKTSR